MNRNTGESPGENRGPLLLCFLCLHHPVGAGSCPACRLFCHASGRAPVGAGVPDGPHRRTAEYRRILVYPSVGAGVPDGPYRFSSVPPIGGIPRFRARVTLGRSPKSDQKRCLKPQVSRLPARLTAAQTYRRIPRETQITAYRRTTNRVQSSYRCRSHVPRGGALVYRLCGGVLACRPTKYASQHRVFFVFCGPTGRTYTCRQRRQVRDLIIA